MIKLSVSVLMKKKTLISPGAHTKDIKTSQGIMIIIKLPSKAKHCRPHCVTQSENHLNEIQYPFTAKICPLSVFIRLLQTLK